MPIILYVIYKICKMKSGFVIEIIDNYWLSDDYPLAHAIGTAVHWLAPISSPLMLDRESESELGRCCSMDILRWWLWSGLPLDTTYALKMKYLYKRVGQLIHKQKVQARVGEPSTIITNGFSEVVCESKWCLSTLGKGECSRTWKVIWQNKRGKVLGLEDTYTAPMIYKTWKNKMLFTQDVISSIYHTHIINLP